MIMTGTTSLHTGMSDSLIAPSEHDHPFVQYVRAAMMRENLIPDQLAARSGISKTTVSFILNGQQDPKTITNRILSRLAKALNVPLWRLIEKSGYPMFEGEDVTNVITLNEVAELSFPPISSLNDIAELPDELYQALYKILKRGKRHPTDS